MLIRFTHTHTHTWLISIPQSNSRSLCTHGWWVHVQWVVKMELGHKKLEEHNSICVRATISISVAYVFLVKKKTKNSMNIGCERSFFSTLLVGDCWMFRWMDGRWCCDLRCHAPAAFPDLTPRSVSPPVTPDVMLWPRPPWSPPPTLSPPLLSLAWLHPIPDLSGKSSLSERKEEKNIYKCIII